MQDGTKEDGVDLCRRERASDMEGHVRIALSRLDDALADIAGQKVETAALLLRKHLCIARRDRRDLRTLHLILQRHTHEALV